MHRILLLLSLALAALSARATHTVEALVGWDTKVCDSRITWNGYGSDYRRTTLVAHGGILIAEWLGTWSSPYYVHYDLALHNCSAGNYYWMVQHYISYSPGWSWSEPDEWTEEFYYSGGTNGEITLPISQPVQWTFKNNTNQAVSIQGLVGGSVAQTFSLGALTSQTFSWTAFGSAGTTIDWNPAPTVLDASYDPMSVTVGGAPIIRSGQYGLPKENVQFHFVFVSYATADVAATVLLDGAGIGSINVRHGDGVTPETTVYDVQLDVSGSSTVSITVPSPHTIVANGTDDRGTGLAPTWTFVRVIDQGGTGQAPASVSNTNNSGGVTVVSTNPTSGTTTITHVDPTTTTNTNTNPATGGLTTGTTTNPTGNTYVNTGTDAGVALSQEALNTLNAIEQNTRETADNSTAAKTLQDAHENDTQLGTTALKSTLSSLQAAPATAVASAQTAAGTAKDNATTALTGAFGDGTVTPTTAPGSFGEPYVDLPQPGGGSLRMYLNPFSASGPFGGAMATAASFVRGLIAWGLVAGFFVWCLSRVREMISKPFATAPFGNSISESINSVKIAGFGGGIGYAVKLAAFALVLSIVLTMPLVLMAALTNALPLGSLLTIWHSGPGGATSGMLSQAIGLADKVVPWAMLMAAPIWYFTVEFVLFPSQFFWMVFIKFLPI